MLPDLARAHHHYGYAVLRKNDLAFTVKFNLSANKDASIHGKVVCIFWHIAEALEK